MAMAESSVILLQLPQPVHMGFGRKKRRRRSEWSIG